MKVFQDGLICFFNSTIHIISSDNTVSTTFYDSKIIINDILLFYKNISTLLHYYFCVIQVFIKYRLSFKFNQCAFFQSRVECVGQDLPAYVIPSLSSSSLNNGLFHLTIFIFYPLLIFFL